MNLQNLKLCVILNRKLSITFFIDEESYLPVCEETLRQGDVIGVTGIGSTSRKQFVFPGPFQEGLFRVNYLQKGFVLLVDRLHFCDERDICTDKIGGKGKLTLHHFLRFFLPN